MGTKTGKHRGAGTEVSANDLKQAEIALRIRDAAIAASINAVAFSDTNGTLTYVNPSFLKMWGYAEEGDVLGRSAASFWHTPEKIREVKDALRHDGCWSGEMVAVRSDGTLFNVELSAAIIADDDGSPLCMMASFVEVTERHKAEAAIAERERRYRTLVEAMAEGVAIHELVLDDAGNAVDYRIIDINPAYENHTGLTREQALGKLSTELYGTPKAPYLDIFAPIALNGGYRDFETYFPPMDKHFRISVFSPAPGQFATIFIDISQNKRHEEELRRSEEKFRQLLEHSPIAIAISNYKGELELLNDRFVEVFGYTLADIPDLATWFRRAYPDEFYRREVVEAWNADVERPRQNEKPIGRREYRVTCKDGRECITEFITAIIDGKNLVILNDVTERKKTLQQIEYLNTALAARAAELESSNRELDAFSHTISHDLRTPLTNICGYTQLMQEMYGDRLDGQARDFLKEIHGATERMDSMIDSLLKFSAVSRQPLTKVRVDLNAVAANVITELQLTAPQRRVQFITSRRAYVQGDPTLLRIVMANLLGNAWKYTAKRESTIIRFDVTERDGKKVYSIRDNGVGFDKKLAEQIFTPFHRLHKEEDFQGTGIGLATAQRIIHRHGGEIWAEAEVDKGATFFFTLGED
ncbi:PAS domain S-box protein [Geomobilimonas luticola]|uniref:histidine kinase n=1 Tax=Geomobilimonas luticola TaxID=1114878 RepID=A0ABS5S8R1_9BACT|nr:PAS domain S-box protein [Geomobilimonas luticola]MBT0651765.1 PAS domain S-box protein [Geomobilimonas luticola]